MRNTFYEKAFAFISKVSKQLVSIHQNLYQFTNHTKLKDAKHVKNAKKILKHDIEIHLL